MAAARRSAKAKVPLRTRGWHRPTRVVAVGGSAAGLAALEQFFTGTANDSGMAYVVLLAHLDRDDEAALAAALLRSTAMRVRPIVDGMRLVADTVYVIPPNRSLVLEGDALRLRTPSPQHGTRRTIDTFFRSLAHECGPAAIGVVLSGLGSDGASGLRAIQEGGGAVLIQDPATAACDAMPLAAIDAVTTDCVLAPELLSSRIAIVTG